MIFAVIDSGSAAIAAALLGVFGLLLIAVLQNRATHERVAQIEHSVNHVEEDPDSGDGQITLGQLVKSIDAKVDQGFEANSGAHRGFEQVQHDQGGRLDTIRRDVDSLHGEFTGHIAAESQERQEIAEQLAEKVDAVHDEVKTVNGHTIAALAEKADAQHTEETIAKGERTTSEQASVDRLHDR